MDSKRVCPHCTNHPLPVARIGSNVVAIMTCPCKDELLLYFRDKIIPLKRAILESGTFEERKEHLGAIAACIFEMGMNSGEYGSVEEMFGAIEQATSAAQAMVAESDCPITREEFEKFVRVDLKCLDSSDYFKRHFS
jgi:hypothetical protein